MNKEEVVKGKNLFDEEKIIDTGMKEPLFIRIPFDEYRKLQKELNKKDKTIDVMSEFLCGIDLVDELGQDSWNWNKKQMKEYFYKKVEGEYE